MNTQHLSATWLSSHGTPVVFLHGLLGSADDWTAPLLHLQKICRIRPLVVNLPYHGSNQNLACHSFDDARALLHSTFSDLLGNQPFWLVGYSLGGRLALDYALNADNPNLLGTMLEGANIGLATEAERRARWQNDLAWAARFRSEPIKTVLADWYRQPVFADLSDKQRADLIEKRQHNDGTKIAEMLLATSLAKQNDYRSSDWRNVTFLIGERDQKFRQMAEENGLPHRLIAGAGHNAHWENPEGFAAELFGIMERK